MCVTLRITGPVPDDRLDTPLGKLRDILASEFKGLWAVTVRAKWRVVFRFADPNAFDVDYLGYH